MSATNRESALDSRDKEIAELKEALRNLLKAADQVSFTECPFSDDCDAYKEARDKAEELLE